VLLTVGLLAGCGGGGGGTLSKSEFIARGDAICKQAHDQYAQLQKNPPATAPEAAALTQKLIGISQSELSQLQDLNAPSEVQPALDRYLKAREQGIALLKKGLQAAENKDANGYAAAQAQIAKGQVNRLKLAQAVGFKECSRPAASTSTTSG
jgi:hypothetical protein